MKRLLHSVLCCAGMSLLFSPAVFAQTFGISYSGSYYGIVGQQYSPPNGGLFAVGSTGAVGPVSYSLQSGTIPPGLTLSTVGVLSGIPTLEGFYTPAIQGTDSAIPPRSAVAPLSIQIYPALSLAPAVLTPAVQDTYYYGDSLVPSGGTGGYSSISVTGLPAGLSYDTSFGAILGVPTVPGIFPLTIHVVDSLGFSADFARTLRVDPPLPEGTVLVPYGPVQLTGWGGQAPYIFQTIESPAPPGMTLTSGGVLSGTPTQAGTYSLYLQVTDALGSSYYQTYNVRINFAFSPATLPHAMVNTAYNQNITVSGGTAPYFWSGLGTIPGTTLTVTGSQINTAVVTVAGTPTTAGTFSLTLDVMDTTETGGGKVYALVVDPLLAISTGSLAPATQNVSYSQPIAVTGGLPPYTISATGLPPGLTAGNMTISGAPAAAGSFNVTVTATDAQGRPTNRSLTLVVLPQLLILTTELPGGTFGLTYSAGLMATGGTPPYLWSVPSGSLPGGLVLNPQTGGISGNAGSVGSSAFTVRVTDSQGVTASRSLSISIAARIEPLAITTDSLPDGTYDKNYAAAVLATGGEEPYTFATSGLPAGLAANSIGGIYGIPKDVGKFAVSVTVTDKGGRKLSKTYTLTVVAAPVVITTASPLAPANVGSPVSVAFGVSGGVPPYTWLPSGGPAGTSVSGGVLSGTPTDAGDFTFTVQVKDSKGTAASKEFAIKVTALPLEVVAPSLPVGRAGQAYSAAFAARGGFPPYSWSISGLPAGLSGSNAGDISGRPAAAGKSSVTGTVRDSKGAQASATVDLTVLAGPLSIETGSPLANGTVGAAYSQQFAASGGTGPYQWSIGAGYAGALGMSGAGLLRGVPDEAGVFNFFVEVSDSGGAKAVKEFSVTIDPPVLTITTGSLPNGTVGAAYGASVAATGNVGPVRWSASGLPAGLAMDASGTISGTPTTMGSSSVGVTATDGAGRSAGKTLSLSVVLPSAPNPTFRGLPETSGPASQIPVGLGLEGSYPMMISGTITLTFVGDAGGIDDPSVQFSNGRRTVDFTIPAGANLATFTIPNLALQTGTVAGVITLNATMTAGGQAITPTPSQTIRINPAPPVITSVTVTRTSTGIQVSVAGYANTREMTQGIFSLTPATGVTLQASQFTMQVGSLFSTWYQDTGSRAFGGQFLFAQPFTVGETGSIASVSVTLVNNTGRSNTVTANVP